MPYRVLRELRRIPTWWVQELLRHVSCWTILVFLVTGGFMEKNSVIPFVLGVLCGKLLWPELPARPISLGPKEQSESEGPPPPEDHTPAARPPRRPQPPAT